MTKNEMLGCAAKALGYDFRSDGYDEHITGPCIIQDGFPVPWNPVEDDGDALRLVVKLRLVVHVWDNLEYVSVAKTLPNGNDPDPSFGDWQGCNVCEDPYAATRLAIVRAAAEIGRAMK